MGTQNVLSLGPHICMTMGLHACHVCIFKVILNMNNTQHCMNGEADNSRFVSMHVYMHLAFKELSNIKSADKALGRARCDVTSMRTSCWVCCLIINYKKEHRSQNEGCNSPYTVCQSK